jgi:hypothetical protein
MSDVDNYLQAMQAVGARMGDFYLLLGRAWTVPAKKPFDYEDGVKKACYQNACLLVKDFPELVYCEGFAMPKGLIPVHHAWCVTPSGDVVDPTWSAPGGQYHGVALQGGFVTQRVHDSGHWGVFGEMVPRDISQMPPLTYLHPSWRPPLENLEAWAALMTSSVAIQD